MVLILTEEESTLKFLKTMVVEILHVVTITEEILEEEEMVVLEEKEVQAEEEKVDLAEEANLAHLTEHQEVKDVVKEDQKEEAILLKELQETKDAQVLHQDVLTQVHQEKEDLEEINTFC